MKEVKVDNKKIKVVTKLPSIEKEDNNIKLIEDTIDLKEVVKEIKNE